MLSLDVGRTCLQARMGSVVHSLSASKLSSSRLLSSSLRMRFERTFPDLVASKSAEELLGAAILSRVSHAPILVVCAHPFDLDTPKALAQSLQMSLLLSDCTEPIEAHGIDGLFSSTADEPCLALLFNLHEIAPRAQETLALSLRSIRHNCSILGIIAERDLRTVSDTSPLMLSLS